MHGKLSIQLQVLDPTGVDDNGDVTKKRGRWVRMYTNYYLTEDDARKMARHFIETNIANNQREDLRVVWQPRAVELDVEALMFIK